MSLPELDELFSRLSGPGEQQSFEIDQDAD
jgi:hypothetical protein